MKTYVHKGDILNVVAKYDKDYSNWILSEKDLGPRFSSKSHFLQIQDNEKITTKLEKLKSEQQYLIPIAKRFESEQQKYLMPEVLIKYDPREVFIIMAIYECIDNNITFETAIELLGISESDILDITIRYINDCHNYRIKEHEKLNFNFDNYCEGTLSRDIDSYTINEVRVIYEIHKKEEDIFYYARRLLIPEILMMKYTLNEIFIFIAIFGYTERRVSAKKVASLLDISESEILDMAARYDSDFLNYTKTHVVETGVSYSKNMLMKNCDKWCKLQ